MKYKVGDRVRIVEKKVGGCWNNEGRMDKWLGKTMTIKSVGFACYGMEEDYGDGVFGDGWCWHEHMIAGLADAHKIVITTDGKTTIARLYDGKKLVKTAEAKCSPDDTFDFMIGAKLAMERLEEKPKKREPKFKVGQYVKVIDNKTFLHCLRVGSAGKIESVEESDSYGFKYDIDGFGSFGRMYQTVGECDLAEF